MRAGGDGASDLLHRWDGRIPRGATSATEGPGGGAYRVMYGVSYRAADERIHFSSSTGDFRIAD